MSRKEAEGSLRWERLRTTPHFKPIPIPTAEEYAAILAKQAERRNEERLALRRGFTLLPGSPAAAPGGGGTCCPAAPPSRPQLRRTTSTHNDDLRSESSLISTTSSMQPVISFGASFLSRARQAAQDYRTQSEEALTPCEHVGISPEPSAVTGAASAHRRRTQEERERLPDSDRSGAAAALAGLRDSEDTSSRGSSTRAVVAGEASRYTLDDIEESDEDASRRSESPGSHREASPSAPLSPLEAYERRVERAKEQQARVKERVRHRRQCLGSFIDEGGWVAPDIVAHMVHPPVLGANREARPTLPLREWTRHKRPRSAPSTPLARTPIASSARLQAPAHANAASGTVEELPQAPAATAPMGLRKPLGAELSSRIVRAHQGGVQRLQDRVMNKLAEKLTPRSAYMWKEIESMTKQEIKATWTEARALAESKVRAPVAAPAARSLTHQTASMGLSMTERLKRSYSSFVPGNRRASSMEPSLRESTRRDASCETDDTGAATQYKLVATKISRRKTSTAFGRTLVDTGQGEAPFNLEAVQRGTLDDEGEEGEDAYVGTVPECTDERDASRIQEDLRDLEVLAAGAVQCKRLAHEAGMKDEEEKVEMDIKDIEELLGHWQMTLTEMELDVRRLTEAADARRIEIARVASSVTVNVTQQSLQEAIDVLEAHLVPRGHKYNFRAHGVDIGGTVNALRLVKGVAAQWKGAALQGDAPLMFKSWLLAADKTWSNARHVWDSGQRGRRSTKSPVVSATVSPREASQQHDEAMVVSGRQGQSRRSTLSPRRRQSPRGPAGAEAGRDVQDKVSFWKGSDESWPLEVSAVYGGSANAGPGVKEHGTLASVAEALTADSTRRGSVGEHSIREAHAGGATRANGSCDELLAAPAPDLPIRRREGKAVVEVCGVTVPLDEITVAEMPNLESFLRLEKDGSAIQQLLQMQEIILNLTSSARAFASGLTPPPRPGLALKEQARSSAAPSAAACGAYRDMEAAEHETVDVKAEAIRQRAQALKALTLSDVMITDSQVPAIVALSTHFLKPLTHVAVVGSLITDSCAADLLKALGESQAQIQSLNLSRNSSLTWRTGIAIAAFLRGAFSRARKPIRELDFSNTKLGDQGAAIICEAVCDCSGLKTLRASSAGFLDAGTSAMLMTLGTCPHLETLDLSWNMLGSKACRTIHRSLPLAADLHTLLLYHTCITDHDGAWVAHALSGNHSWQSVDLSGNQLGMRSALVIADVVESGFIHDTMNCLRQTSNAPRNRALNLSDNPLGLEAVTLLWKTVADTNHLRDTCCDAVAQNQLDIARCVLRDPSAALAERHREAACPDLDAMRDEWRTALLRLSPERHTTLCAHSSVLDAPVFSHRAAAGSHSLLEKVVMSCDLHAGSTLVAQERSDQRSAGLGLDGTQSAQGSQHSAAEMCKANLLSERATFHELNTQRSSDAGEHSLSALPRLVELCLVNCSMIAPAEAAEGTAGAPELTNLDLGIAAKLSCDLIEAKKAQLKAKLGREGGATAKDGKTAKKDDTKRKGKGKGTKSKKNDDDGEAAPLVPHPRGDFRVDRPLGRYELDLNHPTDAQVLKQVLRAQESNSGVMTVTNVSFNSASATLERLREACLQTASASRSGGEAAQLACLTVDHPVVLQTRRTEAMSASLLDYAVALLTHRDAQEAWKLAIVTTIAARHLLSVHQALRILQCFDPERSVQEMTRACQVLYMSCTDPLDFWIHAPGHLFPRAFKDMFEHLERLGMLDIANPNGRYELDCANMVDRGMLMRLQELAIAEQSCGLLQLRAPPGSSTIVTQNMRNVTYDGRAIAAELLTDLRRVKLPRRGRVVLDYVTWRTSFRLEEGAERLVCNREQLVELLSLLKSHEDEYVRTVLDFRKEYLSYGRRHEDIDDTKNAIRQRAKRIGTMGDLAKYNLRSLSAEEKEALFDKLAHHVPITNWHKGTFVDASDVCRKHDRVWVSPDDGDTPTSETDPLLAHVQSLAMESKEGSKSQRARSAKRPAKAAPVKPEDLRVEVLVEEAALSLLHTEDPDQAVRFVCRLMTKLQSPVLTLIAKMPYGIAAVASLLRHMSPVLAARYLLAMHGTPPELLLPEPWRAAVLIKVGDKVRASVRCARDMICDARHARNRRILWDLRRIAASRFLSTYSVTQIMKTLQFSSAMQVEALVILWHMITDRANVAGVLAQLRTAQVEEVMTRLGYFNVLSNVSVPFGCHFKLELMLDADHEQAAKLLCRRAALVQAAWAEAVLQVKLQNSRSRAPSEAGGLPAKAAAAGPTAPGAGGGRLAPGGTNDGDIIDVPGLTAEFTAGLAVLPSYIDTPSTVLENVLVDGKPLVGRSKIQLQYLWPDIAGRASTLEFDFISKPEKLMSDMAHAAQTIARMWRRRKAVLEELQRRAMAETARVGAIASATAGAADDWEGSDGDDAEADQG